MSDAPHEPDTRPGRYYVSVRSGDRWSLLYGPFGRHADALAAVAATRRAAETVDRYSVFYAFGTARLSDDAPAVAGRLNHLLPPIAADTLTEEPYAITTD